MANKMTTTRIRLPPIDGGAHDFFACSSSGTRTASRGKTDVKRNAPQESIKTKSAMFPSLVQPICNQPHCSGYQERRKTLQSMKITHVEKIPTHFPGKAFAALPPIGETRQHSQPISANPSLQTAANTRKAGAENESQSMISSDTKDSNFASTFNRPRRVAIKKQASILTGVPNADRKQEYEVRNKSPTKTSQEVRDPTSSIKVYHSDFKDDGDGMEDNDDDDLKMVNLSEALQFLEWSSELREFLNGKNSSRRGATCSEIDAMLPHVVDVIRDMLLRQTMEELCMMW